MKEIEECDVCKKTVKDGEEGLLCDGCLIWKHRTCLSMGLKAYQRISKSEEDWLCENCKVKGERSEKKSSKRDSQKSYTIADVMAKLEEMDTKYNNLFMKYQEQVKVNNELKEELLQIKMNKGN
ncbi:unnamed protein product [Ceutorhynchus assimilis]|uniref:Zinc finger PHD-type domain-containing protein n=1 Tax=Ceutorhynchus assimilis TaxID=467358 RepID=A0A9N9MBK7_9CUCU|nr:unnamed protein product [Ceutorhynchus assimilis]